MGGLAPKTFKNQTSPMVGPVVHGWARARCAMHLNGGCVHASALRDL